ncbi:MAG: hypothetical protein SRB1_02448 [Desulfobacteraceae bacterium Eth-SRB1]|nr:MAG: hypothetical protein SRB1_02448 [Desulfobacteraceae bacterium Eth-SRB1]
MKADKIQSEIEHGKRIAKDAINIWGWGTPAGQIRANRRAGYFIQLGNIKAGRKVLELGCGTGEFTKRIAETGVDITGVDISPDLLKIATGRIKNKTVRFQIQNVEKMDFDDESFDIVFGSSILHHLNLKQALLEIYRVLREGGRIVFTEPNMLNPQIWLERNIPAIRSLTHTSPGETAFLKWHLKRELLNHGFKDVRIRTFDFLHPLTSQKLIQSIINIGNVIENIPLVKEIAGSLLIHASKR